MAGWFDGQRCYDETVAYLKELEFDDSSLALALDIQFAVLRSDQKSLITSLDQTAHKSGSPYVAL